MTPPCPYTLTKPHRPVDNVRSLMSSATQWKELRNFVLEALADTTHQPEGFWGIGFDLSILISRRLLAPNTGELSRLSNELQDRKVFHSINYVLSGTPEPQMHRIDVRVIHS